MITNKRPNNKKIEIDLKGPQGNAFCILGMAENLSKQLGRDSKKITDEMMSGDYENLLQVFDREFGNFVIMYR